MNHEKYMKRALELAEQARGRTSPNPMVGAVIVKNDVIVGKGFHQKAGTPHAEVHALKEAGSEAKGATIYVTLEPCSHYGRTPPCSEAIISSGIKKVVVAMVDPNPLVAGRGVQQLRDAGIEVEIGVLETESRKLNEVFLKYITTKKPFVLFKTAMTLDGKIATSNGDSKWVTGSEARYQVHQLRNTYDGIMVGVGTVVADDPSLTTRLGDFGEHLQGKDPIRIIVDSLARIPLESKVLNLFSASPTLIATTEKAPTEKLKQLKERGATVITCKTNQHGRVDLEDLMIRLGELEISSIMLEGGSQLAASALEGKLVDKVLWFIAPKIVGDKRAPGPIGEMGINKMSNALLLKDIKVKTFGDDISIEGYF